MKNYKTFILSLISYFDKRYKNKKTLDRTAFSMNGEEMNYNRKRN